MKKAIEINFDGLIGPTHNYGGLSYGNLASMHHQSLISNPKEAALQGLAKMRHLHCLGIPQGIFPPHERPYLPVLRRLGFTGSSREIIEKAWKAAPEFLIASSSAASMWTANAATVCPSIDSEDGRVHFTPANLVSKLHRSFESDLTAVILKKIFSDKRYFIHHDPLPASNDFADEGAANHTRFCSSYDSKGLQLFVYGRSAYMKDRRQPVKFPARQTLEASEAVARLHRVRESLLFFAQQNPKVIDAGVFHNDVISVGNENLFFTHESAFLDQNGLIKELKGRITDLCVIQVSNNEVSVEEAVKTYLFNSQLVTIAPGKMALIAPIECKQSQAVSKYLEKLMERSDHPIKEIHYLNLRESMQNGGGPACLRLRVVLTGREQEAVLNSVIFTDELDQKLTAWVNRHYRDQLKLEDLADPELVMETERALDELTGILGLGKLYSFQI